MKTIVRDSMEIKKMRKNCSYKLVCSLEDKDDCLLAK